MLQVPMAYQPKSWVDVPIRKTKHYFSTTISANPTRRFNFSEDQSLAILMRATKSGEDVVSCVNMWNFHGVHEKVPTINNVQRSARFPSEPYHRWFGVTDEPRMGIVLKMHRNVFDMVNPGSPRQVNPRGTFDPMDSQRTSHGTICAFLAVCPLSRGTPPMHSKHCRVAPDHFDWDPNLRPYAWSDARIAFGCE